MKKLIPLNIYSIILLLIPLSAFSMAEIESALEGGIDLEFESIDGQACYDYLDSKGYTEGFNERSGKQFFIAVGVDSSGADMSGLSYADSVQNAFIRSQINAKTSLAEFLSKQISSEIENEFNQSFREGKEPAQIIQARNLEAENYEELSTFQKMKLVMHQKLDDEIRQENKDKVGQKARDLEKQLEDVLNQNVFRDSIQASANANIRGMKALYSNLSAEPGANRTSVCSVAIWSENISRYADAMATGNFQVLKRFKNGKPLKEYIPQDPVTLAVTFGAFMVKNDLGELSVLSYSQAGMKTGSSLSEKAAFSAAKLKAERAIIQLRDEAIELEESINSLEVTTEGNDGLMEYYLEENIRKRQVASAQGSLQGATVLKRWKQRHPVTGRLVAGVVVAWSPSSAEFSRDTQQVLNRKASQGSRQSISPADLKKVQEGSDMGDDEDIF